MIACLPNAAASRRGFTLTELLTVVGIMALLLTVSIPAYTSMTKASNLTTTAQTVMGQLSQAQQTALTRNASVEIRFYRLPDCDQPATASPTRYRAMQLFLVDNTGAATPLNKTYYFPQWIVTASTAAVSSLVNDADTNGIKTTVETTPTSSQKLGPYGTNYRYRSFFFKPGGNTNLSPAAMPLLTIVNQKDQVAANNLPSNFITIQVDPVTGRMHLYHP